MISFRFSTEVKEDRQVVLTLPPEVPTGKAEISVIVKSPPVDNDKLRQWSLADWAEENAEHWGNRLKSEDVESFTGRRF
jgi:hypothetical protein